MTSSTAQPLFAISHCHPQPPGIALRLASSWFQVDCRNNPHNSSRLERRWPSPQSLCETVENISQAASRFLPTSHPKPIPKSVIGRRRNCHIGLVWLRCWGQGRGVVSLQTQGCPYLNRIKVLFVSKKEANVVALGSKLQCPLQEGWEVSWLFWLDSWGASHLVKSHLRPQCYRLETEFCHLTHSGVLIHPNQRSIYKSGFQFID